LGGGKRRLRVGRQEDAHEFLVHLLDRIKDLELKAAGINQNKTNWRASLPTPRLDETTVIHRIFGGYLRSQVTCHKCHHKSNTYDPFLDLSLEVASHRTQSLMAAFKEFTRKEVLDRENLYRCGNCRRDVIASKQLTVFRPPLSLIVQLKRFSFAAASFGGGSKKHHFGGFGGGGGAKITKAIAFPLHLSLPLSDGRHCEYTLTGVVVHVGGSVRSGHYTAFVNAGGGKWYHADDDYVKSVSENVVKKQKDAYVLFYCRKEVKLELPSVPLRNDVQEEIKVSPSISTQKKKQKTASVITTPAVTTNKVSPKMTEDNCVESVQMAATSSGTSEEESGSGESEDDGWENVRKSLDGQMKKVATPEEEEAGEAAMPSVPKKKAPLEPTAREKNAANKTTSQKKSVTTDDDDSSTSSSSSSSSGSSSSSSSSSSSASSDKESNGPNSCSKTTPQASPLKRGAVSLPKNPIDSKSENVSSDSSSDSDSSSTSSSEVKRPVPAKNSQQKQSNNKSMTLSSSDDSSDSGSESSSSSSSSSQTPSSQPDTKSGMNQQPPKKIQMSSSSDSDSDSSSSSSSSSDSSSSSALQNNVKPTITSKQKPKPKIIVVDRGLQQGKLSVIASPSRQLWKPSAALSSSKTTSDSLILGNTSIDKWDDDDNNDNDNIKEKRETILKSEMKKSQLQKRKMRLDKWDSVLDEGKKKKVKTKTDGASAMVPLSPKENPFHRIQSSLQKMQKGRRKGSSGAKGKGKGGEYLKKRGVGGGMGNGFKSSTTRNKT